MKTIFLGLICLNWKERVAILLATIVAIALAVLETIYGKGILSSEAIGPLVLLAFCFQSLIIVGVVRFRSLALNKIFVDTLKELHVARVKLGESEPSEIMHRVAVFLGDKE